jgi:hypothetical protein
LLGDDDDDNIAFLAGVIIVALVQAVVWRREWRGHQMIHLLLLQHMKDNTYIQAQ